MPNDFNASPQNLLYVTSGMDPVLRWDGLTCLMETAGVAKPATALTITGSGIGGIVGAYRAYTRFEDRLGLVSSFSPVAIEFDAEGITGIVLDATNEAPININTTAHGLQTGNTIIVKDVEGNTDANGTFKVTVVDADNFTLDTSSGNGAYRGGGTWTRGLKTITYTNVPTTDDPKIRKRQIFRNTDGQFATFFLDVETQDMVRDTFTSTREDLELSTQTAQSLLSITGADLALNRHDVPPADRTFNTHILGRMFMGGEEIYRQGSVSTTYGSPTVTGIGTEWTPSMKGRFLHVDGARNKYEVKTIDSPTSLTLTANYLETTDPFADYAIRPPDARRNALAYSESGLPESFPPTNVLNPEPERQHDVDTGLARLGSFLHILQTRHMHRFTFQNDPAQDGFVFPGADRGCVNQRCWIEIEDQAYMLDERGIHLYSGNEDDHISTPIQDVFDRHGIYEFKIRWEWSRFFHSVHDPGEEVLRWFVTIGGGMYPQHAIAMDYRHNHWWLEEYPWPVCSSALGLLNGQPQVYLGSTGGRIFAYGTGELDGVDPNAGTTRGTVTGAGLLFLADTAATFSSTFVNAPLSIIAGTGKGQRRKIIAVSGTTLKIDYPWAALPDTTSEYQVGGIDWQYRTGVFRWFKGTTDVRGDSQNVRRVETISRPTANAGTFDIRIFPDRKSVPFKWEVDGNDEGVSTKPLDPDAVVDMTKANGYHQLRFDSLRERHAEGQRFVAVELRGTKARDPVRIYGLTLDGAIR